MDSTGPYFRTFTPVPSERRLYLMEHTCTILFNNRYNRPRSCPSQRKTTSALVRHTTSTLYSKRAGQHHWQARLQELSVRPYNEARIQLPQEPDVTSYKKDFSLSLYLLFFFLLNYVSVKRAQTGKTSPSSLSLYFFERGLLK